MDNIFRHFIPRADDSESEIARRKGLASWFVVSFPSTEFDGEDLVMYKFTDYCSRLNISMKEKYLKTFLDVELKELVVKNKIKVEGTETLQFADMQQTETIVRITSEIVYASFNHIAEQESELEDFVSEMSRWMSQKLAAKQALMHTKAFEMLQTSVNGKLGSRDSLDFVELEVTRLQSIYNDSKLETVTLTKKEDDFIYVCNTGIPSVDEDIVGLFAPQLITVEAAAGVGKTRFTFGVLAYQALMQGKNVLILAGEQSHKECESIFVARHAFELFGKQIPDSYISKNKLSDELKRDVEIAKQDLLESGKYGKLTIDDDVIYLEEFVQKIKLYDKLHGPYDMIIIDHMSVIRQKGGEFKKSLTQAQITAEAYQLFKFEILKKLKKSVGIAINQRNLEGAENDLNDRDTGVAGSAGGAESGRISDFIFRLVQTKEMEAQNKIKLQLPKKRSSAGFGAIMLDCRKGISYFRQSRTTNKI